MNDVVNFATLLAELIEDAKKLGGEKNSPFTAERFFIAIIDRLNADDLEPDNELLGAGLLIKNFLKDLRSAREHLLNYVDRADADIYSDELYVRDRLRVAALRAAENGVCEIDTVDLVLSITAEPSEALKAAVAGGAGNTAGGSDTKTKIADEEPFELYEDDDDVGDGTETLFQKAHREYCEKLKKDVELYFDTIDERSGDIWSCVSGNVKSDIANIIADVKRIRTELQNSVYGQENAISAFTGGYFRAELLSVTERARRRPRATFLFAGPPGVGKTFLAEKAAEALGLPFMRFDMSEYADKEANLEFCGSDKVYKNAKSGNVTSFVAKNPECVLLFDEIEKAHLCVIHLFLQMLDAGRLRDNYTDEEISFSDAIIILTTNAGRGLYEEYEESELSTIPRRVVLRALRNDINPMTRAPYFPAAICSRFASGNVIVFDRIEAHDLSLIAKKEIEGHAVALEKKTGIKISVDEAVYTAMLLSEGSNADARTVKSRAEAFFNDELYELLRLVTSDKIKTGIEELESIRIIADTEHADAEIAELFESEDKTRVLIFADEAVAATCRAAMPELEFIAVHDVKSAVDAAASDDVGILLLDMSCGAEEESTAKNLNIEDVDSPARDLFKLAREQRRALPVYLLETCGVRLNEEELVSLMRQGARGVVSISDEADDFASRLGAIVRGLHRQASMIKLARENKLISFETAQTVSADGKNAEIRLFDFEMNVAVDVEDSRSVVNSLSKPNVRFSDVIGAEAAKEELSYFVEYLKAPKKYAGSGVKAPKGVLLYGPPGTGKTMLAKAMACEAGITFIAAEGNRFLKKYVGEGAEKVHALFKTARKYAPAILFIDEIDAIARERGNGAHAGSNGDETLTAFLTEMDGFFNDPSKPVFVLAATNFDPEPGGARSLDPALVRRFDRRICIDLPGKDDRAAFLKMKLAENGALRISEELVDDIALRAVGMSLAELDSAVELALRSAIRSGSAVVDDAIMEEAFETFGGGEVRKWDASRLERVARHEAGHALICWLNGETPSYLTVVARGSRGGYMQRAEHEGPVVYTKDELLVHIATALGGRAAEMVYYGDRDGVSTGAGADLEVATNIARRIVCTYGMDDEFGLAVMPNDAEMSAEVRTAVNRILEGQLHKAIRLITENKDKLEPLVKALMAKDHLNGSEIEQLLGRRA